MEKYGVIYRKIIIGLVAVSFLFSSVSADLLFACNLPDSSVLRPLALGESGRKAGGDLANDRQEEIRSVIDRLRASGSELRDSSKNKVLVIRGAEVALDDARKLQADGLLTSEQEFLMRVVKKRIEMAFGVTPAGIEEVRLPTLLTPREEERRYIAAMYFALEGLWGPAGRLINEPWLDLDRFLGDEGLSFAKDCVATYISEREKASFKARRAILRDKYVHADEMRGHYFNNLPGSVVNRVEDLEKLPLGLEGLKAAAQAASPVQEPVVARDAKTRRQRRTLHEEQEMRYIVAMAIALQGGVLLYPDAVKLLNDDTVPLNRDFFEYIGIDFAMCLSIYIANRKPIGANGKLNPDGNPQDIDTFRQKRTALINLVDSDAQEFYFNDPQFPENTDTVEGRVNKMEESPDGFKDLLAAAEGISPFEEVEGGRVIPIGLAKPFVGEVGGQWVCWRALEGTI